MKFTYFLTFVFITSCLIVSPVFSEEKEETVLNTGFEINNFTNPSTLKLLAKFRLSDFIVNHKNQYQICLRQKEDQVNCGRAFEFDKDGQIYGVDALENNHSTKHPHRSLQEISLKLSGDITIATLHGILAEKIYNSLTNIYIEKEETAHYIKEQKKAFDVTCFKLKIEKIYKYSCNISLLR
jgi:hypothetical protein